MIRQGFPHELLHQLARGDAPLIGDGFQVLDQGLRQPYGLLLRVLAVGHGWRGGCGQCGGHPRLLQGDHPGL
jgi:hypothetical protein